MTTASSTLCPDDRLGEVLAAARGDPRAGLTRVDALLAEYPADARLHFLKGSLLAATERFVEARSVLTRATELAPEYAIARYQLGLLELTSGDPAAAMQTWAPLERLHADDPLRVFAEGFRKLAVDDFAPALADFRRGILLNRVLPELNHDVQLVIDAVSAAQGAAVSDETISETHLLLRQYQGKTTRH